MPKPNNAARKLAMANRQRVIKKCTRKAREMIDIDHYKPNTKVKATYWLHKTRPQLKKEDRATIETGKWLTDDIVNASLTILKEQFGGSGLQNVNCGLVMNFTVEAAEFIQIVHDPIRQHWLLNFNSWCKEVRGNGLRQLVQQLIPKCEATDFMSTVHSRGPH